jgi:hypothetical protein
MKNNQDIFTEILAALVFFGGCYLVSDAYKTIQNNVQDNSPLRKFADESEAAAAKILRESKQTQK